MLLRGTLIGAESVSFVTANQLYGEGRFANAVKLYEKSLHEGANASLAFFNMGNCYYQMNLVPKAIACYKSAIVESPGFFTAYLNLGVLYQAQEKWPEAIAVLETADALEPDNRQVVLMLGVAYRNMKAYALAVRDIERTLALDSTITDCYFLLFDIYQELQDLDGALRWLAHYPDNGKRAAEKYHLLASVASVNHEYEKAAFLYRKEAEMAPGSKWARYDLVTVLQKCGHPLLALDEASQALRQFNDFSELALLAGNIAFEAKSLRDAQKYFQIAYSLGDARGLVGLQNVEKSK
jgi:tetratricopeptide (TPR) repeat protein